MNRFILFWILFVPAVLAAGSRPKRRASVLSSSFPIRRKHQKRTTRVKRQLIATTNGVDGDNVKSLRKSATEVTFGQSAVIDLLALQQQLPEVSVWKMDSSYAMDDDADEGAATRELGHLMLSKSSWLEIDEKYAHRVDAQCLSSTAVKLDNDDHDLLPTPTASTTVLLNTTLCPVLDITLQMVNSISTRLLFTPDGGLVPFEVYSTDYVGTLKNMEKESAVVQMLTDLDSVQFGTETDAYDFLVLNGELRFDRVHDCATMECFGQRVFRDSAAFWSLEAYRSKEGGSTGDWVPVDQDMGVWVQVADEGTAETASALIEPQQFGFGAQLNRQLELWTLSLLDGSILEKSFPSIEPEWAEALGASLNNLESIIATGSSVVFDMSEIPYSLEISSATRGDAVFYLGYIGETMTL